MLKKFCVKCGEEEVILNENGLCEKCAPKEKVVSIKSSKQIVVYLCHCGNAKFKSSWDRYENIEELFRNAVRKALKDNSIKYDSFDVDFPFYEIEGKTRFPVHVTYSFEDIQNELIVVVKVIPMVCVTCSRQRGSYYETIIQLRGEKVRVKEIEDYVVKGINSRKRNIENAFITNILEVKGGIDLYVGSSKAASTVVNEFKKLYANKYNIEIKNTFKIIGQKDTKDIKRNTILIRIKS